MNVFAKGKIHRVYARTDLQANAGSTKHPNVNLLSYKRYSNLRQKRPLNVPGMQFLPTVMRAHTISMHDLSTYEYLPVIRG